MALQSSGSLWQQVVGSGVIRQTTQAVPNVRDAKKSHSAHNLTVSHLRGSIWRWCGSQWRSSVSITTLI